MNVLRNSFLRIERERDSTEDGDCQNHHNKNYDQTFEIPKAHEFVLQTWVGAHHNSAPMRANARPNRMMLFSWSETHSQLTSGWPDLSEKNEGLPAMASQLRNGEVVSISLRRQRRGINPLSYMNRDMPTPALPRLLNEDTFAYWAVRDFSTSFGTSSMPISCQAALTA